VIFGKRRRPSEIGDTVAAEADQRLEDRNPHQLELMLDLAKTALNDAQARATALDAKSLAAIGFGVALLALAWPRFAGNPALSGEYLAACFTGACAAIGVVLSALGFTLIDLPELRGEAYLPPESARPASYTFPSSDDGLLRRHLISVHVLHMTLDEANSLRADYLGGAQWFLIAASLSALVYTLLLASTKAST
jgi:hypothetical protein